MKKNPGNNDTPDSNPDSQRGGEPKHIGEIITNMNLDPKSIQNNIRYLKIIEKQQQALFNKLQDFIDLMDMYNTLYCEGSELILTMEKYLEKIKKTYTHITGGSKKSIDRGYAYIIYEEVDEILGYIKHFEEWENSLVENMKLIEVFFTPHGKEALQENCKKIHDFTKLYVKIRKDFLVLVNQYKKYIKERSL